MIKLTNIKIRYGENTIITDGNIELNPGDLCLITGDSGSGKSSLLKVLSLNMQSVTNYYFNDVNLYEANETIISEMKKNKIAYVTQNNMLFKDLTVLDNLEFFSEMGYGCINSHLIEDLGSRLNISKIFKKKAAKLSGGEKQRVAIACAVLKNAELYLFDEPTSMVDIDNKRIINDIFNELSTEGKIVVIVSHEPIFINHNIEYSIEGKNLVSKKNNCKVIEKTSNINPINKQSNKSIREFSLKTMLSHPIINAIYVFIFGISIAMITSIIGASIGNINYQSSMIDLVNCPELFVINTGEIGGSSSSDDEILPEMSDELVTEISALENVVSVNRFIY